MARRRSRKHVSARVAGADAADEAGCPFCSQAFRAGAIERLGGVFAVPDARPVSAGHVLVVTERHTPDFFTMTAAEHRDALALLRVMRERAIGEDPAITGFTVGANCGVSAGQQVAHAHIHLIPRREGEGVGGRGVKGVIRNKLAY